MRIIPWDDELVNTTYNNFKHFKGSGKERSDTTVYGYVAEALVQSYYKQPINDNKDCSDAGWDMEIEGIKIDIKCQNNKLQYFNSPSSYFNVNANKPLKADMYLFCQIDSDAHVIALIGYLTKQEVIMRGKHYNKGDNINSKLVSTTDCYILRGADLNPVTPEREI